MVVFPTTSPAFSCGDFFLLNRNQKTIALIIQKEVAQRIVAKDGKESILSISVKAYGEPHYIKTISKKLFSPEPKVNSAIINIDNIFKKNSSPSLVKKIFLKIVKSGFLKSKTKKTFYQISKKNFLKQILKKYFLI